MTMQIQELARRTGVPAKTIRYYESIGLLPPPERAANNYRQYAPQAVERLRFIASARSLGFPLADIGEFLEARDHEALPCRRVVDSLDQRIMEIDRRIADLLALRDTLVGVRDAGASLPAGKKCDEQCICTLIETEHGQITIPREEKT
jgi:DNA-binding transcriptional MerR regulator